MSGHPAELRYLATFTAAVGIPGAQAAVSGFSAALIAGSIAGYLGNPRSLTVAVLAGGVVFGLAWIGGVAWWRSRIAGKVQESASVQSYPAQSMRVEVVASDPSGAFLAGAWADLPVEPGKLIKLARRVEAGASFSLADLAGRYKPLSRSEFETLRTEFIARGLAVWVNPGCHNQGAQLTRAGAAVLRRLSESTDDPPTTHHAKILPRKLLKAGGLHTHTYTQRFGE